MFEIKQKGLQSRFAKRHDPLLLTFAGNADHFFAKIDIGEVYANKFANTNAGRVQKLDDRTVAAAKIGVDVWRLDKADGVFDREMVGQFAFDLRRRDLFRRVRFKLAFANEELEKCPQAGEFPRDTCLLMIRVQLRHPFAYS